jgi:hypothetical protein
VANSQLELANENLAGENCCDPHAFVLNIQCASWKCGMSVQGAIWVIIAAAIASVVSNVTAVILESLAVHSV